MRQRFRSNSSRVPHTRVRSNLGTQLKARATRAFFFRSRSLLSFSQTVARRLLEEACARPCVTSSGVARLEPSTFIFAISLAGFVRPFATSVCYGYAVLLTKAHPLRRLFLRGLGGSGAFKTLQLSAFKFCVSLGTPSLPPGLGREGGG